MTKLRVLVCFPYFSDFSLVFLYCSLKKESGSEDKMKLSLRQN